MRRSAWAVRSVKPRHHLPRLGSCGLHVTMGEVAHQGWGAHVATAERARACRCAYEGTLRPWHLCGVWAVTGTPVGPRCVTVWREQASAEAIPGSLGGEGAGSSVQGSGCVRCCARDSGGGGREGAGVRLALQAHCPLAPHLSPAKLCPRSNHFMFIEALGRQGRGVELWGHRMAQGFFSLKGLVAAGMPTRKGSLLACSVQNCSRSAAALDTCRRPRQPGRASAAPSPRCVPASLSCPNPHLHAVDARLHP